MRCGEVIDGLDPHVIHAMGDAGIERELDASRVGGEGAIGNRSEFAARYKQGVHSIVERQADAYRRNAVEPREINEQTVLARAARDRHRYRVATRKRRAGQLREGFAVDELKLRALVIDETQCCVQYSRAGRVGEVGRQQQPGFERLESRSARPVCMRHIARPGRSSGLRAPPDPVGERSEKDLEETRRARDRTLRFNDVFHFRPVGPESLDIHAHATNRRSMGRCAQRKLRRRRCSGGETDEVLRICRCARRTRAALHGKATACREGSRRNSKLHDAI